jgi:hypothetical protein
VTCSVRRSAFDEQGYGNVSEQRMYQLIRQSKPIGDRDFTINFLDTGAEVFCFTFSADSSMHIPSLRKVHSMAVKRVALQFVRPIR